VREITKLYEEAISFNLSEGLSGEKRGEYVIVVEGAKDVKNPLNELSEREHILHYIDEGMSKKDAIKQAAKDRGMSKSDMYKFGLDI
jgi:16S rRNA (cytidine1402-2'-O)-methyltransferase